MSMAGSGLGPFLRLVPRWMRACYLCGDNGHRFDPWYAKWLQPYYVLCRKHYEQLGSR